MRNQKHLPMISEVIIRFAHASTHISVFFENDLKKNWRWSLPEQVGDPEGTTTKKKQGETRPRAHATQDAKLHCLHPLPGRAKDPTRPAALYKTTCNANVRRKFLTRLCLAASRARA